MTLKLFWNKVSSKYIAHTKNQAQENDPLKV